MNRGTRTSHNNMLMIRSALETNFVLEAEKALERQRKHTKQESQKHYDAYRKLVAQRPTNIQTCTIL